MGGPAHVLIASAWAGMLTLRTKHMAERMPPIIEDPLWDLMLSTHSCHPGCGCGGDFFIKPLLISRWLDEFGEEFGRIALRQVDDLLAMGPSMEGAVVDQRFRRFSAPETVTTWLQRWRSAISVALDGRGAAG